MQSEWRMGNAAPGGINQEERSKPAIKGAWLTHPHCSTDNCTGKTGTVSGTLFRLEQEGPEQGTRFVGKTGSCCCTELGKTLGSAEESLSAAAVK
jgi:hypothetical protein